jgi:hypothetical protein
VAVAVARACLEQAPPEEVRTVVQPIASAAVAAVMAAVAFTRVGVTIFCDSQQYINKSKKRKNALEHFRNEETVVNLFFIAG